MLIFFIEISSKIAFLIIKVPVSSTKSLLIVQMTSNGAASVFHSFRSLKTVNRIGSIKKIKLDGSSYVKTHAFCLSHHFRLSFTQALPT